MNLNYVIALIVFIAATAWADEKDPADESAPDQESVEVAEKEVEFEKPTGRARRDAEDQVVAAMVEEYNEAVEEDMDEVVCKRERITGQRTKVRVCKTRRQILDEQEATKRLLQQRNRASSGPAQPSGVGSN